MKRRYLFAIVGFAILAMSGFGLLRLLVLRFSTGDVFPPYSSLRSDPLGTKIFFDTLASLPQRTATRNERDLAWIGPAEDAALYLTGVRDVYLSQNEKIALETFVQNGGRFVITYYPQYQKRAKATPTPSATASGSPTATPHGLSLTKLLEHWDVRLKRDDNKHDNVARRVAALPLEETLEWHSGIAFEPQHADWHPIYQCKRGAVVIERQFGRGSVVIAADSFFLSNEALALHRAPEFLAWLNGGRTRAIFDETHFGVHERIGLMTLLRSHGLGGFVAGLVLFVALWLWRNATWSLAPRRGEIERTDIVSGRELFTGFVNLLRRGIAPTQLLDTCVAEWNRTASVSKTRQEAIAAIRNQHERDTVAAYNEITELLHTRKWKT